MERIEEFLQKRKQNNLLRYLRKYSFRRDGNICLEGNEYIDFSSNDYLGITNHPKLKEAAKKAIEEFGIGAAASRLLSGDLEIHHQLEKETALFKKRESALIFNSGYQANVGIINSLCTKEDVIFFDKLAHASLIDGIFLSGAKNFRFRHNDYEHLEFLVNRERNNFKEAFIITETVFSMDGDVALLEKIVQIKEKYNCKIMVDEAHATGIFGLNGTGIVEQKGLIDKIDYVMGTFSKALGSFGAYFVCSQMVKDYLINNCRSFIYSTALPPSIIASNLVGLKLIKEESFRRTELLKNAQFFRDKLKQKGFSVRGSSQIVPLIIGDNEKTIKLAQALQNKGWWVLPIRTPTVPAQESRLRFSLTYYHTKEILERLIGDICAVCRF